MLAFAPCFLLLVFRFSFLFLFFPASRYVYLLRVPSSVQQPSATLSKYVFIVVRVLSACWVICTLPHLGFLLFFIRLPGTGSIFFVALVSRVAFFFALSRTRYAST